MDYLNRRTLLTGVATAPLLGLAGCLGSDGSASGTLSTRVTDQPMDIEDFESCVVTITAVIVKPEDGDTIELDADASADLTQLVDDSTELVGDHDLDVGTYEYLQIRIGEVDGKLKDGGEANVDTPGNAPLKFDASFEIRDGETTTFVGDFTPVKQGQSGSYTLQPVADGVKVIYEGEDDASDE